jgi:hypothetical protein
MLIAERDGLLVDASLAERAGAFTCPECGHDLILRRGEVRVSHFAHKPPIACREARGETAEHNWGKAALQAGFAARGLRAEVECRLVGDPAERRSDLVVWSPSGRPVAVEIQRSVMPLAEIRRRTVSYMAAGIPVVWVAVLQGETAAQLAARDLAAGADAAGLFLDRLPLPAWARFAAHLVYGRSYWLDPDRGVLWFGRLEAARTFAQPFLRDDPAAGPTLVGGRWQSMKSRVDLRLRGPVPLGDLVVVPHRRRAARLGRLEVPAGPVVWFDTPDGLDRRIEAFTRAYRGARAEVLGRAAAPKPGSSVALYSRGD